MEVRRDATLNRYALPAPWLRKVLLRGFSSGERQSSLNRYAIRPQAEDANAARRECRLM